MDNLIGVGAIVEAVASLDSLHGMAIDASLIIKNKTGHRMCEKALSRDYAGKKAGCHATNLSLYPDADSVKISNRLMCLGFNHFIGPGQPWQLECYPHPALIEIFGLDERHLYKKGTVVQKRRGQCELVDMLVSLQKSPVLKLSLPNQFRHYVDPDRILGLRGRALKHNEDVLDAIICLYIAGLYQIDHPGKIYGDAEGGYIYIPKVTCI